MPQVEHRRASASGHQQLVRHTPQSVEAVTVEAQRRDEARAASGTEGRQRAAGEEAEIEAAVGRRLAEGRAFIALLPELQAAGERLEKTAQRDLRRQPAAQRQGIAVTVVRQTCGRARV